MFPPAPRSFRLKTKICRSIERDSEDLIRIGFDGRLFVISRTAVKATGATADVATQLLLDLSSIPGDGGRDAETTIDASDVDGASQRFAAAVWREDGNGQPEDRQAWFGCFFFIVEFCGFSHSEPELPLKLPCLVSGCGSGFGRDLVLNHHRVWSKNPHWLC